MEVSFSINGKIYMVNPSSVSLETTLNTFIRKNAKLTGTKFMCLEGGCGACVVSVSLEHPVTKIKEICAVNSCLQNIYSCHGWEITTVEGLGSKKTGMHKIQSRLANFNGTQCGFCSSGMIMNMHSLMEANGGKVTMEQIENSFGGNICRCTGYRPILDAFKSLAANADEKLLLDCHDIEDLDKVKSCTKTGLACSGNCKKGDEFPRNSLKFIFTDDEKQWNKVYSTKEIFELFGAIGDKKYMLVAGNTAHGVYRRSPDIQVFIDISSVDTLRDHSIGDTLEVGGNVTLSEIMHIFMKASANNSNFSYVDEMIKHIDIVANVPVRNFGTLAGNLMIKHAHKEFPSDIFILLEAISAKLTIAHSETEVTVVFPKEFLDLDMNKKIITKITFPQYDPNRFIFKSYKIMPRAQNAHAYVNAAFLFEFTESKSEIVSAQICYGGIKPKTIHATATEKYLIGKNLYTNETMAKMTKNVLNDIKPDWVLPDASPGFRRRLACALLYKFVLSTAPPGIVGARYQSGGNLLERSLSSGQQIFQTYQKNWPLTKNIPKIEADVQCTGEAEYICDLPAFPNEVYAAFVLAKEVGLTIANFDTSEALKQPGVLAFFSAKDIPGTNSFVPKGYLFYPETEEVFCSSKVLFYGHPAGIIVAENQAIARRAASMVKIIYEKEENRKKILPTIREVLDANDIDIIGNFDEKPSSSNVKRIVGKLASILKPCTDTEISNLNERHKIVGSYEQTGQYHMSMETIISVCVPKEDGLDVYASTQWLALTQFAISEALNIPTNYININVRRLGGAYGLKISRGNQVAVSCALAAHILNKPVRMVLTLEEVMTTTGKRHPCVNDYEIEVDEDGLIKKFINNYLIDSGYSYNEGTAAYSKTFFGRCYDMQGWVINSKDILTDSSSNTWCRSPGSVESVYQLENMMEHIAHVVGKDPFDVRMKNISRSNSLRNMLKEFAKSVEYKVRRKQIDTFNCGNRWIKRGIAIIPMNFNLDYFGQMNVIVSIYHRDGTVAISHGGVEMGQGLNTKVVQTAAFVLGIPLEKISIKPSNNLVCPNGNVSGGSIASETNCFAVKIACETLLKRLEPIRKSNPKAPWEEITGKAYEQNIDLVATYNYKPTDLKNYDIYGATCCEVEVDILTGSYLIQRIDILEDVGQSMSPGIDVGQIEGALVMGLGHCLMEELVYDKSTGELVTNRTWNYKVPGPKDIPVDFRIKFLQNSSNPFGVLRSKATGEPAICMSFSVLMALRHALSSARADAVTNADVFFTLGVPSTVETIFLAANNLHDQYLLN